MTLSPLTRPDRFHDPVVPWSLLVDVMVPLTVPAGPWVKSRSTRKVVLPSMGRAFQAPEKFGVDDGGTATVWVRST